MNIFYSMQRNIKLRNNSQHHITILALSFWVWKPPGKPKMGKSVQQPDIDFIIKNMELLQSLKIHPNLVNAVLGRITGQTPAKPQHPPVGVYDPVVRSSTILLLAPPSSQLNPLSDFLSLSVSCLCWNTSVCVLSTN